MSADDLRKVDRKLMAEQKGPRVKVFGYTISTHAQFQLTDRDIKTESLIENLCTKPDAVSPITFKDGLPSYKRMNGDTTVVVNPIDKTVITIYRTDKRMARQYGFKRSKHLETESERVEREANKSQRGTTGSAGKIGSRQAHKNSNFKKR